MSRPASKARAASGTGVPSEIPPEIASLGYEDAVASLESIIERIESGEIGLEASLAEYRRGVALVRHCRQILGAAEQQVQLLSLDAIEAAAAEIDDPAAGDAESEP
jgi:exodeoxyribonuclease VII small subunit